MQGKIYIYYCEEQLAVHVFRTTHHLQCPDKHARFVCYWRRCRREYEYPLPTLRAANKQACCRDETEQQHTQRLAVVIATARFRCRDGATMHCLMGVSIREWVFPFVTIVSHKSDLECIYTELPISQDTPLVKEMCTCI